MKTMKLHKKKEFDSFIHSFIQIKFILFFFNLIFLLFFCVKFRIQLQVLNNNTPFY